MTTLAIDSPMFSHFLSNPVKILHRLKEAGFTEKQAEVQVEILSEQSGQIEATLATKQDLKRDLKELETALRRDMKEMELKFESRFREMEMRLTIRMGTIVSAVVGFFYLLERFF
ncbi:MAG: hypothetical protein A2887_00375 [Alphaproteobacteria bacterium RIFCSPLOWO2_01_FULL_40_26]|nr:MAG: hypothetical protein A3D15_00745 [Alphaproteobacteria bacterium RIFCSPHIGHO2_02_FULL_40_34]OFW86644.1 MAG: hypothetical protein A2794_04140 [Alphaproteobacteria bacterium RIFCSPHIGHO2_01_FULL_40_8]OFW94645.1 MAG: hypothetical protein A2887_00375 [Alphaproteobacteria bacterium RIFCSPLOWO2_01_FULL_40_26]OFX10113.1 MAG: hypothetical protein A3H30_04835 [Alphaproteobacteria bacterium RIFCSPLOWO2_02_FULL_40_19]OFX11743.1 MAG: hypothetical protein A3G22_04425 [Alphaproteobacteria bacterium RI